MNHVAALILRVILRQVANGATVTLDFPAHISEQIGKVTTEDVHTYVIDVEDKLLSALNLHRLRTAENNSVNIAGPGNTASETPAPASQEPLAKGDDTTGDEATPVASDEPLNPDVTGNAPDSQSIKAGVKPAELFDFFGGK